MRVRFTRDWISSGRVRHQQAGDVANVSNALAARLAQSGHAEILDRTRPHEARETKVSVEQYHVGGGWYDLPGMTRKVRREEAEAHLRG